MDSQPTAPPVVAVVVATEQGDSLEECLAALGAQDYPNQSVLVVDAGRAGDPAPRVAAVLPDAYLRRPANGSGFAALANDALSTVQGSAFLLFCHDDVAPAPDAVRILVEEALRSNAGIVGPKLVDWEDPERLLDVGLAVDKTGETSPLVERGELDQEQHDAVRDVFAVSSACLLARSDLFFALGGFDPAMGDHGADVDLCWRAQVAGARVMVVPSARARHREAGAEAAVTSPRRLREEARNHLRTVLKNYSLLHLARVLPQAAVVMLGEAIVALFTRRWGEARALAGAWVWNLRHLAQLPALRRSVRATRAVPDNEVRRLQVRGSVRMAVYLRRQLHAEDRARALVTAGQQLMDRVGRGPAQAATGLLVLLVLAFLLGSRHLFGGRLPAVGQLLPFPRSTTLLSHFLHGWRTTGLGSASSPPPAFGLLGAGGLLLLGKVALLQKLLVLTAWPVAAVGAWRLGGALRSGLGRIVLVVAYLAIPLSYNSLSRGHWDGLIAFAAAPFLLVALGQLGGLEPFDGDGPEPQRSGLAGLLSTSPLRWGHAGGLRKLLGLTMALALLAAFAPAIVVALLLIALGVLLGSLAAGEVTAGARALGAAVVAIAGALVLLLPWSLDLVSGGWASWVGPPAPAERALGLGALLRFQVGPLGAGVLGWTFLLAAVLPLILSRGWRLAWAVRCWAVALLSVGVAWAGGRDWLPLHPQAPDVLLAPAAIAVAAAVALGAAAFESDLSRYRFGWRQVASVAAGVAVTLGTLPVLALSRDGRWNLPRSEATRSLAYMNPGRAGGAFRVLWLGDPEVLPGQAWSAGDGLAYSTSRDGPPVATDLLPGPASGPTKAIVTALRQAEDGDTSRLGRLLAPMAVRYVVLPTQLAGGERRRTRRPPPPALTRALGSQLDLRLLPSDPATVVYENTAWGPTRGLVPAALAEAEIPETLSQGADLSGTKPVLDGRGPVRYAGRLPSEGTVLVSEAPSSRWVLTVDGDDIPRTDAFGVASAYPAVSGGRAVLRYRTPLVRYVALLLEAALWVGAVQLLRRLRRRTAEPAAGAGAATAATPARSNA